MAGLVLVMVATLLPFSVLAQDPVRPAFSDAFEFETDVATTAAEVGWTVTQPGQHWRVELVGPEGATVRSELSDAEGAALERSSGGGRAALFDLALPPADYIITLSAGGGEAHRVKLATSLEPERFDPEPNDSPDTAAAIADGEVITGRLARVATDDDLFELVVPADDAVLRDVSLTWDGEKERQLCLLDQDGGDRQCRRVAAGDVLTDLALEPGAHRFRVRGNVEEQAAYELSVTATGPREADYETEPNDEVATASAFDPELGTRGRSTRYDWDSHAVTIEGEPQLWTVTMAGDQVDQLLWVRSGDVLAASQPGCRGEPAVLDDIILVPGTHRFRVRACDSDYSLSMTPLGPRDPEGEREPNGDELRAERYQLGERRIGRLTSPEDYDRFRFTLAGPEVVRLRLEPPPDGSIDVRLSTGNTEIFRQETREAGAELETELLLDGGDYLLSLWPREPSAEPYVLSTERLDPFTVAADAEPNQGFGFARMVPPSLSWEGTRAGGKQDVDGYWLPALSESGPVTIRVDDERPVVRLFTDPYEQVRVELVQQDDGSFVGTDVPAGVPLYLELHTQDDYAVELESPGWVPTVPQDLPVEIGLELDADEVAAYWPEGQLVPAAISLTNDGDEDLELLLETISSHFAWRLVTDTTTLTLPAGTTEEIAARVEVQPDVWADAPVLLSVAAVAPDGGLRSVSATIDAGRDADAAGSSRVWPVPVELRGGLNVASAALGGVPAGTTELDREVFLYDDVTPPGSGYGFDSGYRDLPLEISIDLAGDSPLPIAGTILNPLARGSRMDQSPRDFELLLSADGETWQSVLRDEMQRLDIDQPFVLDEPVLATHAMLRVHSLHGAGSGGYVTLGEWKVVAEPGATPDPMPSNIAEPIRGGHLARIRPYINGPNDWQLLINDDLGIKPRTFDREAGALEIVLGFQEGRAAQITELHWQDPTSTTPEERADRVDVEVSTEGPLGPWERVASWQLQRAGDGSVAPLVLDEPVWARYVRLLGDLPPDGVRRIEYPGRIEVHERGTDDEYRSILGEWGYVSDRGPYELLVPPRLRTTELDPDAGDSVELATPLEPGVLRTDRAEILEDVDWYRVVVPAGSNTLTIDVDGVPTVGVGLTLHDQDGAVLDVPPDLQPDGRVRYEAIVEPGTYDVLVEQPPFNVVFTFDTSGSMGPYP